MEKHWTEYQCKSGQTLFTYNKETGEHKWLLGLPEAIEYRVIYSRPAEQKQVSTIATQTDDNGCSNGCMSMYIFNTDTSHVSNTHEVALPQQQSGISNGGNTLPKICTCEIKLEPRYEQEEYQSSEIATADQNNLMKENSSKDSDHCKNTLGDADQQIHTKKNLCCMSEILSIIKEEKSSTKFEGIAKNDVNAARDDDASMQNYADRDGVGSSDDDENDDDDECDDDSNEEEDIEVFFADRKELLCRRSDNIGKDAVDEYANLPGMRQRSEKKKIGKHECSVCQKVFKSKGFLQRHAVLHAQKNHFKCRFCMKIFSKNSILTLHLRTHTGEKPFQCTVCKKKFRKKFQLMKHVSMYSGKKPFECTVFNKKFHQGLECTEHGYSHTGEKPYRCLFCQKKFRQSSKYSEHLKTHALDKPFECSFCDRKFLRKRGLALHQRMNHLKQPEDTIE